VVIDDFNRDAQVTLAFSGGPTVTACGFRPCRSAIPADADHPYRQGDHPGRDAAG